MQLIGRERETKELTRLKESNQAEFVAQLSAAFNAN